MLKKFLLVIALTTICSQGAIAESSKTMTPPKEFSEKFTYALGLDHGNSFRRLINSEKELEYFLQGIRDSYLKNTPLISEEEAKGVKNKHSAKYAEEMKKNESVQPLVDSQLVNLDKSSEQAALSFVYMLNGVMPNSTKDQFEKSCKTISADSFFEKCLTTFTERKATLLELTQSKKLNSANFNILKVSQNDQNKHIFDIEWQESHTFLERNIPPTVDSYLATIEVKLNNSNWQIHSANISLL